MSPINQHLQCQEAEVAEVGLEEPSLAGVVVVDLHISVVVVVLEAEIQGELVVEDVARVHGGVLIVVWMDILLTTAMTYMVLPRRGPTMP